MTWFFFRLIHSSPVGTVGKKPAFIGLHAFSGSRAVRAVSMNFHMAESAMMAYISRNRLKELEGCAMRRLKWIAVSVAVLIAYNGALASLEWRQRRNLLDDTLREASIVADILVDEIENIIDRTDRTLSGIGEVVRVAPSTQNQHDPYAHRLLMRRHAISPTLQALFFVNSAGTLWNSSSNSGIPPIDVSDRDYFKYHVGTNSDGIFIGSVVKGRANGDWLIPASRAVRDQFGRLVMVVAGSIVPKPGATG